jgi:hypothetical protein
MIPIEIQCSCGQRFAFNVEPVQGRMPESVGCPTCGCDVTEAANQAIAFQLNTLAAASRVKRTEKWLVVTLCVAVLALVGVVAGAYIHFNRPTAKPTVEAAPAASVGSVPETAPVVTPAVTAPQPDSVSTSTIAPTTVAMTNAPTEPEVRDQASVSAPASEKKSSSSQRDPSLVAIGMLFLRNDKTHRVEVTRIVPNSPADKAGIAVGDVLLKVNGKSVQSLPLKQVADMIFGPVGSKIKIDMIQAATGRTNHIKITRQRYAIR